MKFSEIKIKHKIVLLVMLISSFVLVLSGAALFGFINYNMKNRLAQEMLVDSEVLSNNCNIALAFNSKDDIEKTLDFLRSKKSIVYAGIYDSQGVLFGRYFGPDQDFSVVPAELKPEGYYFTDDYLTVYKGIVLDEEIIGTLVIRSNLDPLYRVTKSVMAGTVVILIVGLGLCYLLSIEFQSIISSPILKLSVAAKKISQSKDFSVRVLVHSGGEIGELIDSFNHMLEQIQARDEALIDANQTLKDEVAQRMKTEQGLIEYQEKLSKSNQELQDFAYVASHDLREPLRKIIAFGEILIETLGPKLEEDDKDSLELMIDGANRLNNMIEALLTYSRVTTRGGNFESVDINKVVEELKNFELSVRIEETNAEVVMPETLPCIEGDPTQIRQLMQNLIANALKYQKKDTISKVEIGSSDTKDGMVRIEVRDNGIGIKENQAGGIFAMFKRLHSKQEYEGTGIGLAVCKKIVERHGGEIGVESTYGEGSTFWFTASKCRDENVKEIIVTASQESRE